MGRGDLPALSSFVKKLCTFEKKTWPEKRRKKRIKGIVVKRKKETSRQLLSPLPLDNWLMFCIVCVSAIFQGYMKVIKPPRYLLSLFRFLTIELDAQIVCASAIFQQFHVCGAKPSHLLGPLLYPFW
ncbi:hypothetical protein GOP47_0011567 [Adiantum capillus-veneris]|uniref:Uncharacterized protein n=1 Tax=Adiantum capillus-veneris TaxID=13818 RepID=A0A9D4ZFI6_ADICA|nr:hypothetical protein GOP47_0011567 [Adiantum capillus-veneris]